MISFETVANDRDIIIYLIQADKNFFSLKYTEQGIRHAKKTAVLADKILKDLDYGEKDLNIAKIAGFLHDIGCAICYNGHAQNSALMAYRILKKYDFDKKDMFRILSIIGSHEDNDLIPVCDIASAVIIADKTDVFRDRVTKKDLKLFDKHDTVHYAVVENILDVQKKEKKIVLNLTIDTTICTVLEYFEIFLSRIEFCKKACSKLDLSFSLFINKMKYF